MELSPDVSQVVAGLVKRVVGVRQDRKVWSLTLDTLVSHYGAAAGSILLYRRAKGDLLKIRSTGAPGPWDDQTLLDFFHNRKPRLDETVVMAPIRVGNRVVGVLALGGERPFDKGVGKEVTEILKILGGWMGCRRDLALRSAECAVAGAVIDRVAPKDIVYRVLHQLRRFIAYDHGASVLGFGEGGAVRVLARQVAWTAGRSDVVGCTVDMAPEDLPPEPAVAVLTEGVSPVWDSLDRVREEGSPPKRSIMAGRLVDRDRVVGLVEISSTVPAFFLDNDVAALSRFLPYLAWCIRRLTDNPQGIGGSNG